MLPANDIKNYLMEFNHRIYSQWGLSQDCTKVVELFSQRFYAGPLSDQLSSINRHILDVQNSNVSLRFKYKKVCQISCFLGLLFLAVGASMIAFGNNEVTLSGYGFMGGGALFMLFSAFFAGKRFFLKKTADKDKEYSQIFRTCYDLLYTQAFLQFIEQEDNIEPGRESGGEPGAEKVQKYCATFDQWLTHMGNYSKQISNSR